jgi:hypothetical protein
MAGPLLRHGILCFEGGIGGDVLRNIFSPDDFFREQIKAERGKEENMKHGIIWRTRNKIKKELTFESYASSMSCPPGVACPCPLPWGFSSRGRGRNEK